MDRIEGFRKKSRRSPNRSPLLVVQRPMHDFRDAFRALTATPVVTVVAILSLALGIGVNTAMFSIVDSLMLRTLPVRDPGQLVILGAGNNGGRTSWTNPIWEQVRDHQQRPVDDVPIHDPRPLLLWKRLPVGSSLSSDRWPGQALGGTPSPQRGEGAHRACGTVLPASCLHPYWSSQTLARSWLM